MKKLIIYLDTSVVGGCFDEEFREDSLQLLRLIKLGVYTAIISTTTEEELSRAPEHVRAVLEEFDDEELIRVPSTSEVAALGAAYMAAKVVPANSKEDAAHIAFATVYEADVLVSWNFKHIVNIKRIKDFNAVNLHEGYGMLDIRSPKELIYGKEEEGI